MVAPVDSPPCVRKIALSARLRSTLSRAQPLPWHRAARAAVFIEHLPVDDRIFDALGRHHQAPAATRQIVLHPRALGGAAGVVVEDRDVGGEAGPQASAPLDAEEVGRL